MKRFHAVIHVCDLPQALKQVQVARDQGADGVWLIGHDLANLPLWAIYTAVREEHPGYWMGINFLDLWMPDVFRSSLFTAKDLAPDGFWTDDAGIYESEPELLFAESVVKERQLSQWEGEYFGGVAFKGQTPTYDFDEVARRATAYMDVVTTSGTATGVAADLSKIKTMKAAVGKHPLAIASGITPENVAEYLPYVDVFMVNTGISTDFHTLDPARVRVLGDKIREG